MMAIGVRQTARPATVVTGGPSRRPAARTTTNRASPVAVRWGAIESGCRSGCAADRQIEGADDVEGTRATASAARRSAPAPAAAAAASGKERQRDDERAEMQRRPRRRAPETQHRHRQRRRRPAASRPTGRRRRTRRRPRRWPRRAGPEPTTTDPSTVRRERTSLRGDTILRQVQSPSVSGAVVERRPDVDAVPRVHHRDRTVGEVPAPVLVMRG